MILVYVIDLYASLTYSQMLVDLTSADYLYFSNPWWSSGLMKNTSVYGKLYFASGDISTNMLQMMYAVFFNKTLADEYQLGDLYQLVIDDEWTLDKLLTLAEGIYKDLNGDSQRDRDDQFGLMVYPVYVDSFYFASGLTTTNINKDGIPELSSDYTGEKIQDLLEKLCGFLFDTNDGFMPPYSDSDDFTHGNILFYPDELVKASTGLRDKTFGFGILPMPKYDENQEDYYTLTSFPYSLYGIPVDAVDPNRASAVLEALAAESYKTVTPALFETAMKVKYSEDENDAMVYDILKNTVVFDFGRVFNDSLSSLTYSMFRNSVINNDTNWTSTYAGKKDALEAMLADAIDKFEE